MTLLDGPSVTIGQGFIRDSPLFLPRSTTEVSFFLLAPLVVPSSSVLLLKGQGLHDMRTTKITTDQPKSMPKTGNKEQDSRNVFKAKFEMANLPLLQGLNM